MSLAEFPDAWLRPRAATLQGHVFENDHVGIPLTLFHDLTIPLEPFQDGDELVETELRLNFIRFGVRRLAELQARTFRFPRNPDEGYIDGSVYLRNAHSPVDVTRITVGTWSPVAVTRMGLDLELALQFEATGFKDRRASLECDVRYTGVGLSAATATEATRVAERFVDLKAYEAPTKQGESYYFFPARVPVGPTPSTRRP